MISASIESNACCLSIRGQTVPEYNDREGARMRSKFSRMNNADCGQSASKETGMEPAGCQLLLIVLLFSVTPLSPLLLSLEAAI